MMRLNCQTLITIAIVTFSFFNARCAQLEPHIGTLKGTYNFWLYTPDNSPEEEIEPKPVIIFLHGASLCGNNLEKVKRYGTIDAIARGRELDAYVIAPQNPGGSWNPDKIMDILDWVADNHNIDYDRVYVLGMSLGGYGTIDLAASYPDRIAAAIAMCGGGTASDLGSLNQVPLWIIHGTADNAVSVKQSDLVVQKMQAQDEETPRLAYDRIPGMNHSQPAKLFYLKDVYEWLFSHTLKDPQRELQTPFRLTNDVLRTSYDGLKSKGPSKSSDNSKSKKKSSRKRSSSRKKR